MLKIVTNVGFSHVLIKTLCLDDSSDCEKCGLSKILSKRHLLEQNAELICEEII